MKKNDKKEMEFEEAIAELENIVEKLEDGKLSLDDSLKKFSRGVKLIKFCRKELNNAEKQVTKVLKDNKGNFDKEVPFFEEENELE
ncbi:MAG: exodeoxyribonuclease VII small subunit [Halanaerobiales bacterium]